MRRSAFSLAITFAVIIGASFTAEAQLSGQLTYSLDGNCQITSFNPVKTSTGVSASMFFTCGGRFPSATANAELKFDPQYGQVNTADASYARVSKTLATSYQAPGRNLCKSDLISGLNFCDSSPTSTSAPSILKCIKDAMSGKSYCPSWNSVGATSPSGAPASTSLAVPVDVNPVGYPSTTGGTFTGVASSGSLSTQSTRTDCAIAVAKLSWYSQTSALSSATLKTQTIAKKPTGCP